MDVLGHKEVWVLKNWCFWTVVLEKTLESPLDCKKIQPIHPRGNQSWIFIGKTFMLKLKLQYFGNLMWRTDSFEKTLMLGKIESGREGDGRGWDGWMAQTQWKWVCVNSGSWWWTGRPGMLQSMGLQRVGHNWATELNWDSGYCCSGYCPVSLYYLFVNPGFLFIFRCMCFEFSLVHTVVPSFWFPH